MRSPWVNAEAQDLKRAGVDIIQLDEPWMEQLPEEAKQHGLRTVNRVLEGVGGTTIVHVCFGYAHVVPDKPHVYFILPHLADCIAHQISIEAAQPKLDLAVLRELPGKPIRSRSGSAAG